MPIYCGPITCIMHNALAIASCHQHVPDKRCAGSLISVDRLVITRPLSASPSTEISEKISAHFLALQKGSLPASRGHRRVPVASSGNYFLWVRATLCFAP